ncbi:S8 family serine peptidase [Caldalkalibacillus salinus]|uniref:S8 family serine peptidase n=1 Tax=Caldalkalibacillus salinus TaxID=2803787 RepID=UPI001922F9BE|nr:S8 family serine peptidase [Caldalkalibacillus salinus]
MKRFWMIGLVLALAFTVLGYQGVALGEEEQEYIVLVKENASYDEVVHDITQGADIIYEAREVGVLHVKSSDEQFMTHVQNMSGVQQANRHVDIRAHDAWIQADRDLNTDDNQDANLYEEYQWDIQRVTAHGAAWDINQGNHDVVVGVVDSGIDFSHPDLQPNLLYGKTFFPEATEEDAYTDSGMHGTHVAGAIAANGSVKGVGPGLGIASYRVSNSEGRMSWAGILDAITTAADDGVDVINLSLGTYSTMTDEQSRLLHQSAKRAVKYAQNKGMIIVGANGNSAMDLGKASHTEPGEGKIYGPLFDTFTDIPWVISVSSTTNRDTLAYYSNYGSSNVDLGAPGGDLGPEWPNPEEDVSLIDEEAQALSTVPVEQGSYGWAIGTSMAAPKVTAAVGMVKSAYPETSPARVITHLKQTAEDLGKNGHDEAFGHGLVDVYEALNQQP